MSPPSSAHPVGLRLWLCYCTTMAAGGWLLSAVRSLTPFTLGLLVMVGIGVWMWVIRHDRQSAVGEIRRTVRRWFRFRGRHALPALYMAIAVVSAGGGALNEPYNYDSFWYRIPRMHHWLAERQWHWVHTHEFRMNASATFSEWVNLPILAMVPGIRAIFLTNLVTYLLLPGTFFVFLEALGVKRRVAWHWMWILPCGWVYAFQAGSLANDLLSTPLLLGAILYACQAARRVPTAFAWSLLAAALLSASKILFLPLMLPWVVCLASGWKEMIRRPRTYLALIPLAGLVSLVPLAVLSHHHTGSWIGTSQTDVFIPAHPLIALAANSIFAVISNLLPPHTPGVQPWNLWITELCTRPPLSEWARGFESFGVLPDKVDETAAGLGLPVTLLALLVLLRPSGLTKALRFPIPLFLPAVLMATATLLTKVGPPQMNRYFAPYFPLLVVMLLRCPANEWFIRKRWWQRAAVASGIVSLFLVMITRQHPFPITTGTIQWLHTRWPGNKVLARANYACQWRHQSLARYESALATIAGEPAVGCLLDGPGEHLYWRAGLRVHDVKPEDDPTRWRNLGLRYLVVDSALLGSTPLTTWATSHHLRIVERLGETDILKGIETPVYLMEFLSTAPAR